MSEVSTDMVGLLPSSHPLLRDSDFRSKYKTELCNNWSLGFCPYGEFCAFAHGADELRKKVAPKYKTKKCKQFFETGYCGYGPRCQFIHTEGRRRLPIFEQLCGSTQKHSPVS